MVKTKKVSTTTTKLVGDENNGLDLEENEILQAEPLFNEIVPKEKTSNIKFIVIVILLIITLQIIIFTLHRKSKIKYHFVESLLYVFNLSYNEYG